MPIHFAWDTDEKLVMDEGLTKEDDLQRVEGGIIADIAGSPVTSED
jgi:hypothetical protein